MSLLYTPASLVAAGSARRWEGGGELGGGGAGCALLRAGAGVRSGDLLRRVHLVRGEGVLILHESIHEAASQEGRGVSD